MESSRMIFPLCDPFDSVILDRVIEWVTTHELKSGHALIQLYKQDIVYKNVWKDIVELISVDGDGFVYRVAVRHELGEPIGYWLHDLNSSRGEWNEI